MKHYHGDTVEDTYLVPQSIAFLDEHHIILPKTVKCLRDAGDSGIAILDLRRAGGRSLKGWSMDHPVMTSAVVLGLPPQVIDTDCPNELISIHCRPPPLRWHDDELFVRDPKAGAAIIVVRAAVYWPSHGWNDVNIAAYASTVQRILRTEDDGLSTHQPRYRERFVPWTAWMSHATQFHYDGIFTAVEGSRILLMGNFSVDGNRATMILDYDTPYSIAKNRAFSEDNTQPLPWRSLGRTLADPDGATSAFLGEDYMVVIRPDNDPTKSTCVLV